LTVASGSWRTGMDLPGARIADLAAATYRKGFTRVAAPAAVSPVSPAVRALFKVRPVAVRSQWAIAGAWFRPRRPTRSRTAALRQTGGQGIPSPPEAGRAWGPPAG